MTANGGLAEEDRERIRNLLKASKVKVTHISLPAKWCNEWLATKNDDGTVYLPPAESVEETRRSCGYLSNGAFDMLNHLVSFHSLSEEESVTLYASAETDMTGIYVTLEEAYKKLPKNARIIPEKSE